MIHFHKWEEIKKIFDDDMDETRFYYRCTKCGKRKSYVLDGDWTEEKVK